MTSIPVACTLSAAGLAAQADRAERTGHRDAIRHDEAS